ncbi:MAG: SMI1/KNR4 family protein [Armatimonadota bacterium]
MYLNKAKHRLEEINEMKRKLKAMGIKDSAWGELRLNEPQPCTEEEVRALEEKLGKSLPAAYREFLLWMGKGVGKGKFMTSEDFFIWNWEKTHEHFSDWLLEEIEQHGEGVELYAPSSIEMEGNASRERTSL